MKKILFTSLMAIGMVWGVQAQALKVDASGNVGVGVGAPSEKLEVDGNALISNAKYFMSKRTGGNAHQLMGLDGLNDVIFNRSAIVGGQASGLIFGVGQSRIFDMRNSGNSPVFRLIEANGRVGIGTTNPDQLLTVNGSASKPGGGSWSTFSDRRLKNSVREFDYGLESVLQIEPVFFKYNGKLSLPNDSEYVGIIAQDMQEIAPFMISEAYASDSLGNAESKYLAYDASALPYMLVNAIKEQEDKINKQEQELEILRDKITQLSAAIENTTNISWHLEGNEGEASLGQNRPNPFSQNTIFEYFIPEKSSRADLRILDSTGKLIKQLNIDHKGKGQIDLTTSDLASGVYFYELSIDGEKLSKRMIKH